LEVVAEVLRRLEAAGLKCHPKKCRWMQPSVEYLGHNIGQGGISPVEAKVSCIDAMPAPTNVSELRSFLGMANYYRRHILDFSKTARPLNQLLKKEAGWEWGAAQREGWEGLKAALKSAPVLQAPVKGLPYQLATDWSSSGMGAVLSQQRPDGSPGVIAYASKSCNPAEQNYSSYEGEMLAAVWAVRHFRAYLHGNKFELFTDHQPLSWLMGTGDLKGKLARWALLLMEHDFTITYRAGTIAGTRGRPVPHPQRGRDSGSSGRGERGVACLSGGGLVSVGGTHYQSSGSVGGPGAAAAHSGQPRGQRRGAVLLAGGGHAVHAPWGGGWKCPHPKTGNDW